MEMLALATGQALEQVEPLRSPVFSRPFTFPKARSFREGLFTLSYLKKSRATKCYESEKDGNFSNKGRAIDAR
jgi:hypothetical protein